MITSDSAGYRLAVEPDAVDAVRFERLVRAGRQAHAESRPAEAAAVLREALSLWRGPALADVREAPFAAAEAERLERARLAAMEDRIDADLAMGADLDLVAELESLTARHPLRERLGAQLIRALALTGRGTEALAAYERIRGLLAEGYGTDPGPHLQQAHLAVLRTELPQPRRPRGNLDVALTSFVGRDDDVRRVAGLFERARLVTLVGTGGSGKTRLANTIGRQLTPPGGVWFVPLAPLSPGDVPRAVLGLVRERDHGARPVAQDKVMDHLAETLADDDLVLVLDNCEHVIDAVALLAATLLGRCPKVRVLATSREPLRIDGETLHTVLPLDVPEPESTDEHARACAAIQLFHDRAAAVQPGFTLHDDAMRAAIEICRRLDGLPLAIELAAARVRALPVQAVAARLDDRFRLLTGGSRTALPRHKTLRAAVAWSWDLLTADERALLERLSVVPGGFTEDAAAAIGGLDNVHEPLMALVDKSLLRPVEPADPVDPRYRMLETIREYGRDQLAARAEADGARERHAAFFLGLAETADSYLRTSDQLRWLARLTTERDNLSAAIGWAVESGDADLADRFGVALCWYWFLRDHLPESVGMLSQVLQVSGSTDPQARALVVIAQALAIQEVSGPDEAAPAVEKIRTTLQHVDPRTHPVLELAQAVAVVTGTQPDFPDGPDERTDPWRRSFTLLVRGIVAMNRGHTDEANNVLSRALAGFEELGERWGLAMTLSTLDSASRRSGSPGTTERSERAMGYFQELGLPEHAMENEVHVALRRAQAGDADGGRRRLTDLLAQAERTGSVESRAQVCLALARLERQAGRPAQARAHALTGLADPPPGRSIPAHLSALLLTVLAHVDVAAGVPHEALQRLDHPAVHLALTWDSPIAAEIAAAVAAIEECQGRPERAGRLLGVTTVLHGSDEAQPITQRVTEALGTAGLAAAHAAGAAMSRTEATDLVSAIITAPGNRQPA